MKTRTYATPAIKGLNPKSVLLLFVEFDTKHLQTIKCTRTFINEESPNVLLNPLSAMHEFNRF